MKENQMQNGAVLEALKKLEETQDPDMLTLEEVMMCRYKLPCRRIFPGTDHRFMKYGRGSILIYKTEVVLILFPNDNTTFFPSTRGWVAGPKRQYKGVLPGSSFYTNGGVHILVEEGLENIQTVREAIRKTEEYYEGCPEQQNLMAWENSAGKLNNHRCSQAFGLAGGLYARRLKRLLAEEA